MFKDLKKNWKQIQDDPPGKRFRRQYKRRHEEEGGIVKKILFIGLGIIIVIAGIFFLPAPGPGMLIIIMGLGLISQESLWMAVVMDKLEIRIRRLLKWGLKAWKEASLVLKILIVAVVLALCGLVIYWGYLEFLA